MELFLVILVAVLIVLVAAIAIGVFLWRRNALSIDKEKAEAELRDFVEDSKRDMANWRDKNK